jgi:hypothetical protein
MAMINLPEKRSIEPINIDIPGEEDVGDFMRKHKSYFNLQPISKLPTMPKIKTLADNLMAK